MMQCISIMRPCVGVHMLISCCGLCVWCRLRIDAIVRCILLRNMRRIPHLTVQRWRKCFSPLAYLLYTCFAHLIDHEDELKMLIAQGYDKISIPVRYFKGYLVLDLRVQK